MNKAESYCIQKIEYTKKEIIIYFSYQGKEEKIALSPSTYSDFYLYEGKEVSKQEMKEIKRKNDLNYAFSYAYSCIQKRDYSSASLQKKLLAKGIKEEDALEVVHALKEQHVLDDVRFAKDRVEILEEKGYGKYYIIEDLKKEGISDAILAQFSFEKEREKIDKILPILSRKWGHENDQTKRKHIFQSLLRLGYDKDLIAAAFLTLEEPNEEEELQKCDRMYQKYLRTYQNRYQNYELKQRIISTLMRKGFSYDIIKQVMNNEE